MHGGCDGYTMFKNCPVLMDEDMCPELGQRISLISRYSVKLQLLIILTGLAIQNHFQAIDVKMGKGGRHSKHRQSLVTLSRRHSMVQSLEHLDLDGPSPNRLHHNPIHPALQQPMSSSKKVKKVDFL